MTQKYCCKRIKNTDKIFEKEMSWRHKRYEGCYKRNYYAIIEKSKKKLLDLIKNINCIQALIK